MKKLAPDSHKIKITHPDKVLFPADGITKGEFVDYHRRIADIMVPHLQGRPLTMFRFHGDISGRGFYQQKIFPGAPSWINRVTVPKAAGQLLIWCVMMRLPCLPCQSGQHYSPRLAQPYGPGGISGPDDI
jgi:DNA primase